MKDTNSFEDFWIAFEGVTVRDSLNTVINSVLIFIPVYMNPLSLENRKVFQKSFLWNRWFEQKNWMTEKLNLDWEKSKMKLDFSRDWVFMSPGPKHNIVGYPIIELSFMALIKTQWRLFEYSKTAETSLDRAGQFGKRSQNNSDNIVCQWHSEHFDDKTGCWRQKKLWGQHPSWVIFANKNVLYLKASSCWDFWLSCCYS